MTTPRTSPAQRRLAEALRELQARQQRGEGVYRTADFTARARTTLVHSGFLRRVTRGWYIPARPGAMPGDTTPWYAAMREFVAAYCEARFGTAWHVDPALSLMVHAGGTRLPNHVIVHTPAGTNNVLALPDGCSLLDYRAKDFSAEARVERVKDLRILTLSAALVRVSPTFFERAPTDAQIVLARVSDVSDLCRELLAGAHSVIAGRLAGAFRATGRADLADEILATLRSAGHTVTETNPFATVPVPITRTRGTSPYVQRLELMWAHMRNAVLDAFPPEPGLPSDADAYLARVNAVYTTDAYHSLSIEGYRVTDALIAKVASGAWRPDIDAVDADMRNAMAAHGYWRAFQSVSDSIGRVLAGASAGDVVWRDHGTWFRALFAPSVEAGVLQPTDLAGYRAHQVYIANARHVPPSAAAVRDMMPALFDQLRQEPSAAVRAVLGHVGFVFIHPYMDGNGRIGRFLMNTMLASGGYSWTVIPVERRTEYFAALEAASVDEDVGPLTTFLATCLMASEAYAEQTTETVRVTAARAEGLATDTGSTESIRSE